MTTSASTASDLKAAAIFSEIENVLKQEGASYVKKVNGVFRFEVKKGDKVGVWIVDVKNGNGAVKFDDTGKGDVTVNVTDDDLVALMTGNLNPQQAFFQGKLKVKGNMGLALKLRELELKGSKL